MFVGNKFCFEVKILITGYYAPLLDELFILIPKKRFE